MATKVRKAKIEKNDALPHIDILNIFAIIGVLFLHHNMVMHIYSSSGTWVTAIAVKAVFFYAVPLFLMITGATLLGYQQRYDTKTFFKKRLSKIIIPLIFWSVFMLFWGIYYSHDLKMPSTPIDFFNSFMGSRFCSIYYFMFAILGIYITLPILSPLAEKKNRSLLKYAIISFFILNTLVPDILSFFKIWPNSSLRLQLAGWAILPLIGYYLNTSHINRKWRILLYALGAASILYHFFAVFLMSTSAGVLKDPATEYNQFPVILTTSALFVFVKNIKVKFSERAKKALHTLSGCSFGVYLIHMPLLQLESRFLSPSKSIVFRFLFPFLTYAICVGIVLLLKKIPFLRRIVP